MWLQEVFGQSWGGTMIMIVEPTRYNTLSVDMTLPVQAPYHVTLATGHPTRDSKCPGTLPRDIIAARAQLESLTEA
jgi:hypothetical protein